MLCVRYALRRAKAWALPAGCRNRVDGNVGSNQAICVSAERQQSRHASLERR